jgi:hypothetical protein
MTHGCGKRESEQQEQRKEGRAASEHRGEYGLRR